MATAKTPKDPTLEDVEAKFAEVAERRQAAQAAEDREIAARKNILLAHHWPHRYERCTVIGGRHVCRRCLWFYSISFVTLALGFVGISPWPTAWDAVMVWILPIPATIDFVLGELSPLKYSPRRQVITTAIMAFAAGRGFHVELLDQGSTTFWAPVLVFGSIWFATAVQAWLENRGQYRLDPAGDFSE